MKIVSNELKNALKKPTTQRKGRIKVNNNYYDVYNVEYYADCYDEGNVIGNAIASQLDFDLPYIEKFNKFEYEDGVWTGSKYEYIKLGTFNVIDERDNDDFSKHITALDNLVNFNKPFIDKNDYPKSLYQELQNICQQANVMLINTSIANENFIIENNQFVNGENLKFVLKNICGISGTYAIIKNDKLLLQLKNTTNEVINKSQHKPIIWKRRNYPINQVVLGMKDVEGEYVLRQDTADIEKNGVHKIVINDNYFAYTQEKREQLIDGLFNQLKGFSYVPFEAEGEWLNYLEIGDTINLDGVETMVLRIDGKNPKSLETITSAPAIINNAVEYFDNTDDIENRVRRTEILVDKQNQQIRETIQRVDEQGSTILEINKSLDGVSEKLTQTTTKTEKIESDLKETNNTITINQQNFDKFKNEEYQNAIGSLQDQIDGAIQFWNGEPIPTLNNYPANEWKTEVDRNNHRADIYTVIKDVNGELKQGKGYRFDKVENTWQWIELTDNELSAVQAIADEANKRSKENAGSITTLTNQNVEINKTINGISGRVSKTEESITNTNTKIDNIQIGGRNLLYNSKDLEGWNKTYKFTEYTDENNFKVVKYTDTNQTTNTIKCLYPKNRINKNELDGKEITITFDAKTDDYTKLDNKSIMIIEGYNEDDINTRKGWQDILISHKSIIYDKNKFENNEWTRFVFKAVINSSLFYYMQGNTYKDINYIGFRLTLFRNGTLSFRKPKLEIGNKATDWTPAPEDINNRVDTTDKNLKDNYYTRTETNSKFEATDTKITTEVSKVETKVTNITNTTNELNSRGYIHATDAMNSKPLEFKISGETKQIQTTGHQLANVAHASLLNNIPANRTETGFIIDAQNNNTRLIFMDTQPIIPGETYTMFCDVTYISGAAKTVYMYFPDNGEEYFPINRPLKTIRKHTKVGLYIDMKLVPSKLKIDNVMLIKGDAKKPFEPYSNGVASPSPEFEQPIENSSVESITDCGKNLFDKSKVVEGMIIEDGRIKPSNYYTSDYIKIDANKDYYKTATGSARVKFFDRLKQVISTESYADLPAFEGSKNFSVPFKNVSYMRFSIAPGLIDNIQLEVGTEPTPYETYKGNTYTFSKPIDLAESDTIEKNKETGKWEVVRRWQSGILTESGSTIGGKWEIAGISVGNTKRALLNNLPNIINIDNKDYVYANYFKQNNSGDEWGGRSEGVSYQGKWKRISFYDKKLTQSLETWKEFIRTHNVEFQYKLATPIHEQLPESDQDILNSIEMFEGTTNLIITKDNLDTYIKYLRKTPLSDDYATNQNLGITNQNLDKTNGNVNDLNNELNNTQTEIKTLSTKVTQNNSSIQAEVSELTRVVNTNSKDFQDSINNINGTLENGVEKLKNTLVTIDIEGIKVSTNYSQISTLMSNKEFAIRSNAGKVLAFIGYDENLGKTVAQMDNLTITNYFTSGYHRQEKMRGKRRTGFFFVRSDL